MPGSAYTSAYICGKPGGVSYANVTRPNMEGKCPTGYMSCPNANLNYIESIICYPDAEVPASCPIVDMDIVSND